MCKKDRIWICVLRILQSTCQIRKMINQTFGAIVDSSAEYCRKI